MLDAQLVSEALIVQIDGMQDKKTSIEKYYQDLDNDWASRGEHETTFRTVVDVIRSSLGQTVRSTKFRRIPLFYTLYAVVFHRIYGMRLNELSLNEQLPQSPSTALDEDSAQRLRTAMVTLSSYLDNSAEEDDSATVIAESLELEYGESDGGIPTLVQEFIGASSSQTDNIRPRLQRFRALWEVADLSR
jgi:hypothetical protein